MASLNRQGNKTMRGATIRPGSVSVQEMNDFRRAATAAFERAKQKTQAAKKQKQKRSRAAKKIQKALRTATRKKNKKRGNAATKIQSHVRKQLAITKKYNKILKENANKFVDEVKTLSSTQQLYGSLTRSKKLNFEKCLRNCYKKHSNMQKMYKVPGTRFSLTMPLLRQYSNDTEPSIRSSNSYDSDLSYAENAFDGINSAAAAAAASKRKKKPSPIDLSPKQTLDMPKKSRFFPATPGNQKVSLYNSDFDDLFSEEEYAGAGESKTQNKKPKTRGRFELLDEKPKVIEGVDYDSSDKSNNFSSSNELSSFSQGGKRRKSKKLRIRISKKNKKKSRKRRKNKKLFGLF